MRIVYDAQRENPRRGFSLKRSLLVEIRILAIRQECLARNEQGALPLDPAAFPTALKKPSGLFSFCKPNAKEATAAPSAGVV